MKALAVNRDGTQCLSGSSDGTMKLWSLGQQRCMQTFHVHDEGVWALLVRQSTKILFDSCPLASFFIDFQKFCLQVNDGFTHVLSGGRDRKIFMTDFRYPDRRVLVCEETEPILKMISTPDQTGIWVATSASSIKQWVGS